MTDNVYYLRFDDEVAKEREDWGSEVPEGFPTMQIVGLVLTALAVYWLYRKVKGNSVVHLLHLPGLWRVAILPN